MQLIWEGGGIDMYFKLSALWDMRGKGPIILFQLWDIKTHLKYFSCRFCLRVDLSVLWYPSIFSKQDHKYGLDSDFIKSMNYWMWDLLYCNLWSKVSAVFSALFLAVRCPPCSLASEVLSEDRMTAHFWRHVCRINSFNNMLVNSWQRSFLFLFLVLFSFQAEAEQFITFCNVIHSAFKGKCHIPAGVSKYWCLMFYQ